MSQLATAAEAPLGRRIRRLMSDQPLIPLIILLIVLVVMLQFLRPGIVNERWIAQHHQVRHPARHPGGLPDLTMLTGGIDLSVDGRDDGAFIMATQAVAHDPATGDARSRWCRRS